jgi:hypothetical protein
VSLYGKSSCFTRVAHHSHLGKHPSGQAAAPSTILLLGTPWNYLESFWKFCCQSPFPDQWTQDLWGWDPGGSERLSRMRKSQCVFEVPWLVGTPGSSFVHSVIQCPVSIPTWQVGCWALRHSIVKISDLTKFALWQERLTINSSQDDSLSS